MKNVFYALGVLAALVTPPGVLYAASAGHSPQPARPASSRQAAPRTLPAAAAPRATGSVGTPARAPGIGSTAEGVPAGRIERALPSAPSKGALTAMHHPSLFFGPDDIEAIRARCQGPMRSQYDVLVAYADAHLSDAPPLLEGDYEARGLRIEDPYLTNILDFSFLYVASGEARYLDAARRWALALASMKGWSGKPGKNDKEVDRGLYEGFGLTGLAAAYDWLYPSLAPEERSVIGDKMAHLAEGIYRATSGGEWWSGAYLHHDHWIPVGGMGVAAMALVDEVPDARKWADKAEAEFEQAFNRLGDEGAWHEGVCGWAFGMASFAPFWDAYGRRFGDRLDEHAWLKRTWAFRTYLRMPDGSFMTFGDGYRDGHYQWTAWEAGPSLRLLAAKYNNPYAQWAAANEWQRRPNPYTAVWEIIWNNDSLAEAPPATLPPSGLFENEGLAILRTGWDRLSTVVAFHADSVVGTKGAASYEGGDEAINTGADHAHADGNAFTLWSRGSLVVTPAWYGQRDTEFQNSLLADDRGQYRTFDRKAHPGRPRGMIMRFFPSKFASFVVGEAAECYPRALTGFERTLYLVDPGIVFIVDKVAADGPMSFKWLYHVDKGAAVRATDNGFLSTSNGSTTVARFGKGESLALALGEDRWNQSILAALTSKKSSARVTAAIVPAAGAPEAVVIDTPAEGVFFADALGTSLAAAFPQKPGRFEAPGRLSGQGAAAIATLDGAAKGFLAVDATELVVDGVTLLSSPVSVTVSCYGDAAGGTLTVSAAEPTQIAINPRVAIKDVTPVGGGRSVPYITDGPKLILNVYQGTKTYDLQIGTAAQIEGD